MTTTTHKEKGFTIGVSCPSCGGELELEDNFFAVACDHCGSTHRIIMPDNPPAYIAEVKVSRQKARFAIDRFLKDKGEPLTTSDYQLKQFYYPYWKIDAILFRLRKGVEKRVLVDDHGQEKGVSYEKEKTDISLAPYTTTVSAGTTFDGLPDTLGMRSDYLKIFPLADEKIKEDFDVLSVVSSWEDVRGSLHKYVGAISSYDKNQFGVNKTDLFGPKAMLIYFPFLLFDFYDSDGFNRFVVDGVTGRVLNHITSLNSESSTASPNRTVSIGEIDVVSHRCHNCGVDLPAEESLVYICHNCQVITDLEPGVNIDSISEVVHEKNEHNIMIPFWAFTIKGVDAELLKSVFGGIYKSERIVIPAFKVKNYNALYKLTKRMSAAFPQFSLEQLTKMGRRYTNVDLPLNEALMLIELFAKTDRYKKNSSDKRSPATFQFDKVTLFYAPFHLESYFYVDSILQAVTLEKNLI